MNKHTPGEWAAQQTVVGVWQVGIPTTGQLLAKIPAGSINEEANARLIAAAPDLLAVCQGILECLVEKDRWTSVSRRLAAQSLRTAIDKAIRGIGR